MSRYNIAEISEDLKEQFEDLIQEFKPFKIAPFQLTSGAYDVVNGAIQQNVNINNETQYEKVFTGQNSTILTWRDSTKLVLKDGEEGNPLGPNGNYLPIQFKRQYKIGKLFNFYLDTETIALASEGGTANTLSSLSGFITGDIEEQYIYDGYVIPRVGNFTYKIEIGQKYRAKDGNIVYTEISLNKVNKIGTTEDIDQVFQLTNSLGEGYAWPVSKILENGEEVITLDLNKTKDDPIKYLQFEFEDPSVVMNIYAYGREANYGIGQGKTFSAPKLLFPFNFQSTDGNKLSGQISPSDYYLFSNNLSVSIDEYYDSWNEKVLTKYSPESIRSYEGHIADTDKVKTLATNPQGENKYGTTYWDGWTFNTSSKEVNVLSPFAEDKFVFDEATTYTLEDMNVANVFRHQHIQKLPIRETETTPRVATEIPVLGIIGKLLFVGTDSGWYNTDALRNRVGEVGGFISKDYYSLLNTTEFNESDTINPMPIDAFGEDRPETIMGVGTMPVIWKFGLTDTYIKGADTETEYTTDNLGVDINGNIELWDVWNENNQTGNRLVSSNSIGFAIDTPVVQSIGKTIIRMTAYNNENKAIYSVRYETSSRRTGDTRDITTIFNTSTWNYDEIMEVPEITIPIPPTPPNEVFVETEEFVWAERPITDASTGTWNRTTENNIDIVSLLTEKYPDFDIDNYQLLDIEVDYVNGAKRASISEGGTEIYRTRKEKETYLNNRLDLNSSITPISFSGTFDDFTFLDGTCRFNLTYNLMFEYNKDTKSIIVVSNNQANAVNGTGSTNYAYAGGLLGYGLINPNSGFLFAPVPRMKLKITLKKETITKR